MTRDEILSKVRAALEGDLDLRWAYVFGSFVRGERFEDVAVMPRADRMSSLLALGRLTARLEEATGVRVDVVDLRDAPPLFAGPLLRERLVVLDREPHERADWEAETVIREIDFRQAFDRAEAVRYEAMRKRSA